jgi:hypothetical protein
VVLVLWAIGYLVTLAAGCLIYKYKLREAVQEAVDIGHPFVTDFIAILVLVAASTFWFALIPAAVLAYFMQDTKIRLCDVEKEWTCGTEMSSEEPSE